MRTPHPRSLVPNPPCLRHQAIDRDLGVTPPEPAAPVSDEEWIAQMEAKLQDMYAEVRPTSQNQQTKEVTSENNQKIN
jgi:hypothetical protein